MPYMAMSKNPSTNSSIGSRGRWLPKFHQYFDVVYR